MAYIDFSTEQALSGQTITPRHDLVEQEDAGFSALEWSVIALARRDRKSSLDYPSRLSIALGSVFGARPSPRLADPRLEALRRMAVLSWHDGFAVPSAEVAAFRAAGFSPAQYEDMLASISVGRSQRRTRF